MKNGDKPAFSRAGSQYGGGKELGFTKREYMATHILTGLCSKINEQYSIRAAVLDSVWMVEQLLKQLDEE